MTPERRDPLPLRVGLRQPVGLVVAQHLGAVFERPQIEVGPGQLIGGVRRDMAGGRQGLEGVQRTVGAELRMAPAQDQLLGLDEEFDLADAATAKLQVRALGGHPLIHLEGMDLSLDRMDV